MRYGDWFISLTESHLQGFLSYFLIDFFFIYLCKTSSVSALSWFGSKVDLKPIPRSLGGRRKWLRGNFVSPGLPLTWFWKVRGNKRAPRNPRVQASHTDGSGLKQILELCGSSRNISYTTVLPVHFVTTYLKPFITIITNPRYTCSTLLWILLLLIIYKHMTKCFCFISFQHYIVSYHKNFHH